VCILRNFTMCETIKQCDHWPDEENNVSRFCAIFQNYWQDLNHLSKLLENAFDMLLTNCNWGAGFQFILTCLWQVLKSHKKVPLLVQLLQANLSVPGSFNCCFLRKSMNPANGLMHSRSLQPTFRMEDMIGQFDLRYPFRQKKHNLWRRQVNTCFFTNIC